MENTVTFLDLAQKLVAICVLLFAAYIVPYIKAFIESNIEAKKREKIKSLITTFVVAAEKIGNMSGKEKHEYVLTQLSALGFEITGYILALIEESVVYDVGTFKYGADDIFGQNFDKAEEAASSYLEV